MKFKTLTDAEELALRKAFPGAPFVNLKGSMNDISSEELRERKGRLTAGLKRILDGVEGDKLTAEQDLVITAGSKVVETWAVELADRTEGLGRMGDPAAATRLFGNRATQPSGQGMRFMDSKGNEVRALGRTELLAETLRPDIVDGFRAKEVSLGRLVRASVTGNWKGAELEQHALGGSSGVLGGFLVPSPLAANVIDLARNLAVCMQAGALTVPMESSELRLAKVTKDPTAAWKVENQPGALSDLSFGALNLSAKTLMCLCSASVELIEDAGNLDSVVLNALAQSIALELDRAALRGDGSAAGPTGLDFTTGVQQILAAGNGAQVTSFDDFSKAVEMIATVNGAARSVIMAPRTAGTIDRLKEATTNAPLQPPPSYVALQKLVSNQVPIGLSYGTANNASEAFIGDFEQMLIGVRTELNLEISRQAGDSAGGAFRAMQVWVRAYVRADIALLHADHFCVIKGIIPA